MHHGWPWDGVHVTQTRWAAVDMVQDRENKVRKNGGDARIEVEANAKEHIPDNVGVNQGSRDAVDQVDHDIKTQHNGARIADADKL